MKLGKAAGLVIAVALLAYVAFLSLLYLSQNSILYPGTANAVNATPPRSAGVEVLNISTSAGHTEAFFLPASDKLPGQKPLVIFAHGNGETIDDWLTALNGFRERGMGVLLVEYPGYGRSSGSPSEASIRAVMDAAYDRIVSDARVDPRRIVGFGRSLGGGAICLLAKDRPLRALMLMSTFPTLDIFAARYWAPPFLLRDHFMSVATVARFPGPILVMHGRVDQLIPWEQGRRLAAASTNATFTLYNCGHDCWDPERVPFWNDAVPFLRRAGVFPSSHSGI
jgi:uncharacterized protein